jgi:flagellar biosynthesis chaperone FliJ
MVNSIHKQNIYNHELDRYISPYQKKILESYKLDNNTFVLTLQDSVTKEIHTFPKWESAVKEDVTVYDCMKRKNITIEKLEIQYRRVIKANQKYDVLLEYTGV